MTVIQNTKKTQNLPEKSRCLHAKYNNTGTYKLYQSGNNTPYISYFLLARYSMA